MVRPQCKQQARKMRPKECGGSRDADQNMLAPDRVVAAVRSLYEDRLEPFGRILLRRIRENHAKGAGHTEPGSVEGAPLINPHALRKVCMNCKELFVQPLEGKEISVLLRDTFADFVDVCSLVDPFPPAVWEQAAVYFEAKDDLVLPGGRYVCAQALVARKLVFLQGLSLAEVCHFVQLCISQKKLLGFAEGGMVPYCHSENFIKEQCAAGQRPFSHMTKEPSPFRVATWEETRTCLAYILQTSGGADACVTVSNMKRLFRSQFGLDLSETTLGYSRLSDLLQDERLHDICRLEARGTDKCVVCRSILKDEGEWMWGKSDAEWPSDVWAAADECWDWQGAMPGWCASSVDGVKEDGVARMKPPPGINGPCMFGAMMGPAERGTLEPMKIPISGDGAQVESEFAKGDVVFLKLTEIGVASVAWHNHSCSVSTTGSENAYGDSDVSGQEHVDVSGDLDDAIAL